MNKNTKTNYGLKINGTPLDGETLDVIPYNMLQDLQTILCYDYEDGKPYHDLTCVMELIFHNPHDELKTRDCKRIRFLYEHPYGLLRNFSELTDNPDFSNNMISIRIDLTAGWFQHDHKDRNIMFDDYDTFSCTINHKKHFHPNNPEMPDD
jgi:hypothetical protein